MLAQILIFAQAITYDAEEVLIRVRSATEKKKRKDFFFPRRKPV